MTTTKALTDVRADCQRDDRGRTTGTVELGALPAWLKNPPYAVADLSVQQARKLAIELLRAAELAEGDHP